MFPFTLLFEQSLRQEEALDRPRVLSGHSEYIKKYKGRQIAASADKLSFTVGLNGWSWDKFAQIERGEFVLSDQSISFRAFMYRGIIIVSLMSVFMAAVSGNWIIGLACFVWLYGGNLVAAWIKYRRMVKDVADSIDRLTSENASANRVFMK